MMKKVEKSQSLYALTQTCSAR